MGQYSKELMQRFRDNRDAGPISPKARAVQKQASKRERELEQQNALARNSRRAPYQPARSKADSHENWMHNQTTSHAKRFAARQFRVAAE